MAVSVPSSTTSETSDIGSMTTDTSNNLPLYDSSRSQESESSRSLGSERSSQGQKSGSTEGKFSENWCWKMSHLPSNNIWKIIENLNLTFGF